MAESIFYVNGEFVPAGQASLPLNDLGIVRGYGVFDFWRTYNGAHFHLEDHLARLIRSAAQIDLHLPWSIEELAGVVNETVARNGLTNAAIRVVATGGSAPDYMTPQGNPSLVIMVTPAPAYPESFYQDGVAVTTTEMVRERPTVKSLNYIGAIMAVEEAKTAGAVEAVYRTPEGHLTEGTRANFFIIKDGQLITPEEEVLFGITRKAVLMLAGERLEIVKRPIHLRELATAEEAFITSSTKEVLPVVKVDEQIIGDGKVGSETQWLIARFQEYAWSLAKEPAAAD